MEISAPLNSPFYRNSLIAKRYKNTSLFSPRQQHGEVELVFVRGARGLVKIGDSELILTGNPQLIIIGQYLPHVWSLSQQSARGMSVYTFHFNINIFGDFIFLPELSRINDIFTSIYKGIIIDDDSVMQIEREIIKLYKATPTMRLIQLLGILNNIALNQEKRFIVSNNYNITCNKKDGDNLKKVYKYVMDYYENEITLEEVAKLLKITRESFSRYFVQKSGITFIDYLTETRIGYACEMLLTKQYPVNEIAQKCGYRNMSHFFHQFKTICGCSAQAFQKQYKAD